MKKLIQLCDGWTFAAATPGSESVSGSWLPAIVPGTVAESLKLSLSDAPDLDNRDWWYQTEFSSPLIDAKKSALLIFEGLATLAEVWLNGELILTSKNMFVGNTCDVSSVLKETNILQLRFRSLTQELLIKKPRPRWKTGLVSSQNLRFIRTTLLGKISGWTPAITPIGPWKKIFLEINEDFSIQNPVVKTSVVGKNGILELEAEVTYLSDKKIKTATLKLGDATYPLTIDDFKVSGKLEVKNITLWWPHTHGEPALHKCSVELVIENRSMQIDCGLVGFKSVELSRVDGGVKFLINNTFVFCRGACWTVNDFLSLTGNLLELRASLILAKESGLNMFRIGGTMIYESDDFYQICDELGILVWQDFMFANFDYPITDPDFKIEIEREVLYQLKRLSRFVSLTVYCGGSEVQQQAAMMGLPESEWSNSFFDETLPDIISKHHPLPYFPSSPCEGALPFHAAAGVTHYYGVGAYRKDIQDVKSAGVKFSAESLGFSNVPEIETMALLGHGPTPPAHLPLWKAGVPRDAGAGWDFEDIRDFYLQKLFLLDPIELRSQDLNRYYEISRVVTGEVMKRVYSEWRRPESVCGGAMVWFFKDLWPGAGWGIMDSTGLRKAVWYELKRVWCNQALIITDEGLDGLQIHLINESPKEINGTLTLELFSHQKTLSGKAELPVVVLAGKSMSLQSDSLLGYFTDVTASYRFGPAKYDVVRAALICNKTQVIISESFYFPIGLNLSINESSEVQVTALHINENEVEISITSKCFLQSVHFTSTGFIAADSYFHLAPGYTKKIVFTSKKDNKTAHFKAEISALNLRDSVTARSSFAGKQVDK